ncbi:hypothetical protein [Ruania halotolerans]|uniref:hypothetical protein n=1 Tax=Ruania halotolerans TaxID=2897773 RepID=UPI001E353149|nr:hypothetical protein [Ruania halotolerans]UFU06087.1 hypothetical protein LQF10_16925 [Ruania halotolerans]
MSVVFVGANPIVVLKNAENATTAVASVWVSDWSTHGVGAALVLWSSGRVRLLGEKAPLARWLERDFTRYFPEVAGLAWPEPDVEEVPVQVDLDLSSLHACAGDIVIRADGILDRRAFSTDSFDLGGTPHALSLVLAPAARGSICVAGAPLPGQVVSDPTAERPTSSAFLTAAEVWSRS